MARAELLKACALVERSRTISEVVQKGEAEQLDSEAFDSHGKASSVRADGSPPQQEDEKMGFLSKQDNGSQHVILLPVCKVCFLCARSERTLYLCTCAVLLLELMHT